MSAKIDEARKLGRDMLEKHGEPTQALPHFISALHRRKLLASVALDFLENLGHFNTVPRDQEGCAETAAADQVAFDAQPHDVGGGTPIDNLGHTGAALTGQPVAAETAAADHDALDAHLTRVGGGTPIAGHEPPDAQQADAGKAAGDDGQLIGETHKHDATSPAAPDKTVHVTNHGKKIREFWRHPPRTEAQKEAARTAAMVGGSQWREYGLDKVRYRELDQFIRDNAEIGTINVVRGVNNFQKAALAALIQRHVVPIDQGQLVTELVSDHELQKYVALAIKWAPKYAATRARADADDVIENVKMIAAE